MKNAKIIIVIAAAVLMSGCAATKQARSVEVSGFLGEYRSQLRPGTKVEGVQQALHIYIKPNLNIKGYKKILLEPVTLWGDPKIAMTENRQDLQTLADSFFVELKEKLSKNYEMVDEIGPDTLRIQFAITHGEKSMVGLSFVSKVIPQARGLNTLWTFASGKPAFTGEISAEFKATDAQTGELLAAAADKRVGGTKLFEKNVFNSWGDVKNVFEYWGDLLVFRLCEYRGGTNCAKPRA